jgi:hypothetical protein
MSGKVPKNKTNNAAEESKGNSPIMAEGSQ